MLTKKAIREDLLDQLERNGIHGRHFKDLIFDYLELWTIKNKLIKDIKKKGVSVQYQNGANQWGVKKNDSIGELLKTSAQMLRILSELGLKPSGAPEEDDQEM